MREKEALAEFAAAVRVKLRFFDELEAVQVGGGYSGRTIYSPLQIKLISPQTLSLPKLTLAHSSLHTPPLLQSQFTRAQISLDSDQFLGGLLGPGFCLCAVQTH